MPAFLGFLKLVPLKDWLYIGAIAVLLGAFGLYTHHERAVGAAKTVAQDTKLAEATRQHNLDVKALADNGITKIGDTYVATIHAPIPDSPHVFVCKRPAPATSSAVSGASSNPGVPDAVANSPEAAPRDIGPPIDKVGRDTDALIQALQDMVRTLVNEMHGKTS